MIKTKQHKFLQVRSIEFGFSLGMHKPSDRRRGEGEMKKQVIAVGVLLLLILCVSPTMYGQATGSFSGTITDKSGGALSGASVRATSDATGAVREATADDTGHYTIPLLPVSVYTLRVELTGFQTAETKDLKLQVDEAREINFSLAPATVSTQVEVSSSAVEIETSSPSLGQVITSQQVAQLPLNGRDFVQLATLTPGTTQETSTGSFFNGGPSSEVSARGSFSLSVGGSRANSTDWLLDGTDNNELTAGGIGILSSIDSIEEFKVLTYNYSAEYGTRAGPTVLVTTKSGTNSIHGTVFEFLRNTALDAKSFFARTPKNSISTSTVALSAGPSARTSCFSSSTASRKISATAPFRWIGSHRCHARRRLHQRRIRPAAPGSHQSQRRRRPNHHFSMRRCRKRSACQSRWQPGCRSPLQQDSRGANQSHRCTDDGLFPRTERQQSRFQLQLRQRSGSQAG